MDSEIDRQILVDRVIEEVVLSFANQKEIVNIPDFREQIVQFNNKNGSDFTIWEIFKKTFTEKDETIVPLKPINTVIQVANLAKQDQEYTLTHEDLNEDYQELGWAKVKITEKIIRACKNLNKKFH